jgi:predicted nucleic acid-binding protein
VVKSRVYLDTSVLSAYFDDRTPERQRLTQLFWHERLSEYEPVISGLVRREIADIPDPVRRGRVQEQARDLLVLTLDQEARDLADAYMEQGIFPQLYPADALHVAIAVVQGCPYLASWNFRHMVRVRTRREVNLVSALRGYQSIEIVAPPEL